MGIELRWEPASAITADEMAAWRREVTDIEARMAGTAIVHFRRSGTGWEMDQITWGEARRFEIAVAYDDEALVLATAIAEALTKAGNAVSVAVSLSSGENKPT